MRYWHALTAGAVGLVLVLAGCSDDAATTDDSGGAAATPTASAAAFNDADVTFAQQMIPHHRQALEMAMVAQERAASAEVRDLAAAIEKAQDPEIQTMSGWLESWGEDVPTGTDMGHGGMAMPDMMTAEDMAELEQASGAAFDRMFLTMMIEHHTGAIEMAKTEQTEGQYADAVALAKKIEADQTAEIEKIRGLLGS